MIPTRRLVTALAIAVLSVAVGVFSFYAPRLAHADAASRFVVCTSTISPGGITTNTTFTTAALACPQIHMGDFLLVSALTTDPGAVQVTAKVTATGQYKVQFSNTTAGTITPASDTYSVAVLPRYVSP